MKKILLLFLSITILSFFTPVRVNAMTYQNPILIAADTDGLLDGYGQEQTCSGNDSMLGDPSQEDSVAWLLNKILTYATLAGVILVVVLSSIDFLKVVVKSDDDAMAKAAKKLGIRLILAALLFFVPTFTNAMLDLFGLTSESTCGIQQ